MTHEMNQANMEQLRIDRLVLHVYRPLGIMNSADNLPGASRH